ncbi:MAG: T9SS C-terminal target domain-containing protein, partial [Saprospiraceae bacterium]
MKNFSQLFIGLVLVLLFSNNSFSQIVLSGADDGSDGTLRKEIMDTPAGGEITFAPTVLSVMLTSEIIIDKDITITGGAASPQMIDGNSVGRIFNITSGNVVLNNLILTNGLEDNGGAIYVANANVTINNSTLTNNIANGTPGSGGAIFNDVGGFLMVSNSQITNNQANRAGGGIEDNSGAGIGISLDNVTLDNNNAGVTPATAAPGNGGGLHITGAGDALITGGTANGNLAALEGGALWNGTGTMTINGTTIDGNTASGAMANEGGGGLFNAGGILVVTDATITNNIANGASGSGGGILNDMGTLTISNTAINNNTSMRAGGGVEENSSATSLLTMTNVNLMNNSIGSAPGNGGGLHITGAGTSNISGGTVSGNIASSEGGGLWNGSGIMTVENIIVSGNTASGAMANQGGGGLFNAGGTMVVMNATISNNIADGA